MPQPLTPDQAKAFYDRLGRGQDWQAFYEDRAVTKVIVAGEFAQARSIFEFGCGTGRVAERLLRMDVPSDCRYLGVDISETMLRLARARLARWGDRAEVRAAPAVAQIDAPDGTFDRFLSTFVFDLLSESFIDTLLLDARRVLVPGGRLCLAGLTHGPGRVSGLISSAWRALWNVNPRFVGGCRPLDVSAILPRDQWSLEFREVVTAYGLSAEALVARRR